MERLTKRMCGGYGLVDGCNLNTLDGVRTVVDRLAAYEDAMPLERTQELAQAEKDGRLVVLPCKVGDVLYHIAFGKIIETKVRSFCIGHPSHNVEKLDLRMIRTDRWDILMEKLGKTVFLTREEAEAALKKRKEACKVESV